MIIIYDTYVIRYPVREPKYGFRRLSKMRIGETTDPGTILGARGAMVRRN